MQQKTKNTHLTNDNKALSLISDRDTTDYKFSFSARWNKQQIDADGLLMLLQMHGVQTITNHEVQYKPLTVEADNEILFEANNE